MKYIVAAFILAFSTATFANGNHHRGHRHNHDWVAPMIGGIVLGAIITREANSAPPVQVQLPPVQLPPPVVISHPPVYQPPVIISHPVPPQPRHTMCLVQVYDPNTGTVRNEAVPCLRY